jgi:hypothetical protein
VKGYLQRMAASAINPVQAIRPVLTPVSADPPTDVQSIPGTWPESVTEIPPEPEVSRRPPNFNPEPTRRTPDVAAARPEIPMDQTIPAAPRVIVRQQELPNRGQFEPLVRAHPTPAVSGPLRQTATAREAANLDPQIELERGPETTQQTEIQTETQFRVDTRPLAPALAQRRERRELPARSQTDDIQIHIGRIEVTAVPSPAPPAIRKSARKSLTLDEYLRRSR